jgi:hypothetical protein
VLIESQSPPGLNNCYGAVSNTEKLILLSACTTANFLATSTQTCRTRCNGSIIQSPAPNRLVAYTEPQNGEQDRNCRKGRSQTDHIAGIRSRGGIVQVVDPSDGVRRRRRHGDKDQEAPTPIRPTTLRFYMDQKEAICTPLLDARRPAAIRRARGVSLSQLSYLGQVQTGIYTSAASLLHISLATPQYATQWIVGALRIRHWLRLYS